MAAVLAYVAYQFRITAILRGHLARLEERMNETLGVDVHMWNSALVETYMAHNNVINSFMMFPMMVFCVVVLVYCFWVTLQMTLNGDVYLVILISYWGSVFICFACIILPSIFGNEKIRAKTYFAEDVWKYYKILRNKKIDAYKRK